MQHTTRTRARRSAARSSGTRHRARSPIPSWPNSPGSRLTARRWSSRRLPSCSTGRSRSRRSSGDCSPTGPACAGTTDRARSSTRRRCRAPRGSTGPPSTTRSRHWPPAPTAIRSRSCRSRRPVRGRHSPTPSSRTRWRAARSACAVSGSAAATGWWLCCRTSAKPSSPSSPPPASVPSGRRAHRSSVRQRSSTGGGSSTRSSCSPSTDTATARVPCRARPASPTSSPGCRR